VDGRNHCPAVPGQAPQRLRHEEGRRAAHNHTATTVSPPSINFLQLDDQQHTAPAVR
jgi:hypothetical protein